jgi:phosphatidylserine/phosphatidylglycerophosphate/cardiolipin synthase-like enzyme
MTSLDELKRKWFIDTADEQAFPPQTRHPGSQVADHTDGNLVTPLIDGSNIMGYFEDRLAELLAGDPGQARIWLAAMGIEPVEFKGQGSGSKDAITAMLEAADAGVQISFLASGQGNLAMASKKFAQQLAERGSQGAVDKRFPFASGHHQKFNITYRPPGDWQAVVGSADFFFARWDDPDHAPENPARPKGPTHDLAALVKGPATTDILWTFSERWNDLGTSNRTTPTITQPLAETADDLPAEVGTHSVQVLRTYPLVTNGRGFSWSDQGEFTIWAAYLQAIKQAQTTIYIEDQYLYPFGDPPFIYGPDSVQRQTDYVYQLGLALKRGVDVVALVPGRNDSLPKHYENQQRRRATEYLEEIARSTPGAGRFVVAKLNRGGTDVTVHSKVMLVDDELALIGTHNICQRSIAYISEIHLGIVDAENRFVRDLRAALWQEHLELDQPDSLFDPREAAGLFQENAAEGQGRLISYPCQRFPREAPYRFLMNHIIDPYAGPERS